MQRYIKCKQVVKFVFITVFQLNAQYDYTIAVKYQILTIETVTVM